MSKPSQASAYCPQPIEPVLPTVGSAAAAQLASRNPELSDLVSRGFGILPDEMYGYGEDVDRHPGVLSLLHGFYAELDDPDFNYSYLASEDR